MNKLLLSVLCVFLLLAAVAPCFAATPTNGVLAEERIVNLPGDQGKWYISVVGNANDAGYKEILGWFDSNTSLAKLKSQVHFCPVTTDTAIYTERYAPNVKALPTVRMQNAAGNVAYEASAKEIPLTAEGLNGALASAVGEATARWRLLPYRREMEKRCPAPGPKPVPNPQPGPNVDPEPQPVDDNATPVVDPVDALLPWYVVVPVCTVAVLVGLMLGYGRKLKDKLLPPVK
jgi:hypothetical protein